MFVYLLSEKLRGRPKASPEYDEYGLLPNEHPVDPAVEALFSSAAGFVANNASRIAEQDLLYLYGRYKQATAGAPDPASRPSLFSLQARRKFQAWEMVRHLTREESMRQYVDKVGDLNLGWDPTQQASTTPSTSFGLRPSRPMEPEQVSGTSDVPIDQFFEAVRQNNVDVVRDIINGHIQFASATDSEGLTALHWACDAGHNEIVDLLIGNTADPNAQDNDGLTPLHYAAMCSHPQTVRLLLENGANPKLRDSEGQTPYDVAQFEENREMLSAGDS